jgi:hyperosmotically inducible periplasmic protein
MNTRYILTLCTALVIGGALITGSADAVSKADEKTVKNGLQVVAPAKHEAIDDTDASITARVNAQFAKDSSLKDAGIHAKTNAGVVSLSGEVSSLITSGHAFWTVWQVPGVKWVKNGLTVKEKA